MRVTVIFDTPYAGWDHSDHQRQMEREVADWHTDEPEMEYQIADALRKRGHEVSLLDASAGIAQASVVQDVAALAERVGFIHQRFGQGAIAEEFIDGRELYVSVLGNDENLRVLPITEMVFDKRKTRPEERIATQLAKWDEAYRDRKGTRNVMARPLARKVRDQISETCRTVFRALWLRDYARLDLRVMPDNQVWLLEANANPFISYGHDMANAAAKAGMEYSDFIQHIVDTAMARYERS